MYFANYSAERKSLGSHLIYNTLHYVYSRHTSCVVETLERLHRCVNYLAILFLLLVGTLISFYFQVDLLKIHVLNCSVSLAVLSCLVCVNLVKLRGSYLQIAIRLTLIRRM